MDNNFNEENLPRTIKEFFLKELISSELKENKIFFCRNDGVVLYGEGSVRNNLDKHSIGALMCGVWQASSTLASFFPKAL